MSMLNSYTFVGISTKGYFLACNTHKSYIFIFLSFISTARSLQRKIFAILKDQSFGKTNATGGDKMMTMRCNVNSVGNGSRPVSLLNRHHVRR